CLSVVIIGRLSRYRPNLRQGRLLAALLAAMILIAPVRQAVAAVRGQPFELYFGDGFGARRAQVVHNLLALPGRHVVFVGESPQRSPDDDWVHNPAQIDDARIIWAHDLGEKRNRELIDYFKDRTFWRLDEENGDHLTPYQ